MDRQQDMFSALGQRSEGLLPSGLSKMHVMLVGAGSVGSNLANLLVRSGLGALTVIDDDVVAPHNLSRTTFGADDIGRNKAEALRRDLSRINGQAKMTAFSCRIQHVDKDALRQCVEGTDLIVAATDDPPTQALLNRMSQHFEVPALFIGLYRGAHGGEVVISVPGLTPCMECYAGAKRFETNPVERSKDYGTGRLEGEIGLGSDIALVVAAASKLALGLLALGGDETTPVRDFVLGAIARQMSVATFGMMPDYWFYPDVFSATSGQYAFQSVWLTVTHRDDCPACRQSGGTENPIAVMGGTVDPRQFTNTLLISATEGL